MLSSITFLCSAILRSIRKKKAKAEGKQGPSYRNKTQPVAHLVMLTEGHMLAGVKSPYYEESRSIMHLRGCEGRSSKAFAYLRCQLPLSSRGHAAIVQGSVCVGRSRKCSIYTLPIMCYLFHTLMFSSSRCL